MVRFHSIAQVGTLSPREQSSISCEDFNAASSVRAPGTEASCQVLAGVFGVTASPLSAVLLTEAPKSGRLDRGKGRFVSERCRSGARALAVNDEAAPPSPCIGCR